jgi:hypothetical protein
VTPKDAMEHPYFKPIRDHHLKSGTSMWGWINFKSIRF